jgi:hypothetical protein
MKSTAIKQFIKLRHQLESERTQIANRLKEVEAALGSFTTAPLVAPMTTGRKRGPKPGSKRKASNELSLKEAVVKAIGNKQMTREQILEGVLATGYRFRTSNPLNSLNVILYGKKPKFSRKDGRFGLA